MQHAPQGAVRTHPGLSTPATIPHARATVRCTPVTVRSIACGMEVDSEKNLVGIASGSVGFAVDDDPFGPQAVLAPCGFPYRLTAETRCYRPSVRQLWPDRRAKVDLAEVYGMARPRPKTRPWIALNMVSSVDGATSIDGTSAGLSGEADRQIFRLLRSRADMILVGAGTVRTEGYGPPKVADDDRVARRERGQSDLPRIAIVSASLDMDFSSRLFTEAAERPLVISSEALPAGRRAAAGNRARVVTCGEDEVDLSQAAMELAQLGAGFVLCEGGSSLNGSLIAAGLVDEVCLTVSPLLVGGDSHGLGTGSTALDPPMPLALESLLEDDGFLFFRWVRRD